MNPHKIASALAFMFARTRGKRTDNTPKFLHPIRVALLLKGCEEGTVIAGLLHDLLEETETTYREIESRFGTGVADLVQSLTHGKESDADVLNRVRDGGAEAVKIKLADNTDNIRTISYFPTERQAPYLKYAKAINNLGVEVLGDHPLVRIHSEMYKFAMKNGYCI